MRYVSEPNSSMRPTSGLGPYVDNSNKVDRTFDNGYLAFGQVLKVYPKSYCADVQIFHTNDKFRSSHLHEGKHGCKIGVSSAGFSDQYQAPYGEIMPIYRGNIVLVGFLKNVTDQPVILKVFHSIEETVGTVNFRNILPNTFDNYTTTGDITDYLKITPIQDFIKVDKFGNVELASHTKTFLICKEGIIPDTYDYEDLSVKSTTDKSVINPVQYMATQYDDTQVNYSEDTLSKLPFKTVSVDEKYSAPKSYMLAFRDKYVDKATNWLKMLVDAAKTSFKLFKFQQEKKQSTLLELGEEGEIKIRRQLDAMLFTDYENTKKTELNPNQNPSFIYSEIRMLSDGTIVLETIDRTTAEETVEEGFTSMKTLKGDESHDFPHTKIIVHPKGGDIEIKTNSKMTTYAKAGIDILSKDNINITSEKVINMYALEGINILSPKDIVINSDSRTQVSSNKQVDMFAPDMFMTGAMDMKGSFDMTGAFDLLGNATFTGSHRINNRGAILSGDYDTNGDRNKAMYANKTAAIAESFLINELSKHIKVPQSASAALAGIFNVSTSGFANTDLFFNGRASDGYNSLSAILISAASPFYEQLLEYANKINKDSGSVTTQIGFLKDILGIDFDTMNGASNSDVVNYVNDIYNKFAKPNYMYDEVTKVCNTTTEVVLTAGEQQILMDVFKSISIEISPNAMPEPLGVNEYNWDVGRDPTFGGIIRENQTITYSSGGGGANTQQAKATIEDALDSLTEYFKSPLNRAVATAEERIDAQLDTNSRQYAYVNRKIQGSSSSGSGGSGQGTSTGGLVYTPAKVTNKSQYVDRTVKRYFFNIAETMLKQANASLKYHNGE